MADITKGLPGLTFESALYPPTREVSRLDNLRRTGVPSYDYENEPQTRFRDSMRQAAEEDMLLNDLVNWRPSRNQRMQAQRLGFLTSSPSEDIGFEAAAAGYGESRFDRRLTTPAQLDDIEDARARMQSTLGVLGNSLAKMGVLAGTTAADSWVGIPSGLINLSIEAASGNIDSARDAFNALVENPVSSALQGINDKSEEIFRNYQTREERERPWWENIFTANFIGDTLIKNAGFTIGAVLGGKMAVGVLGNMTGAREARDAFKGLAAELGLSGKNASEVVEMLAKGTSNLEQKAAVKALAESAQNLKNAELGLKIAGGLLAGTGEARIEALHSASELEKQLEEVYGNLDLQRSDALKRLNEEMIANGIDINTPDGRAYYEEKKAIIDNNYIELKEQIAHDKATAANTVFALNVPLLTAGDMFQWGKLMLGGYATDRSLVKGIKKVAEKAAIGEAKRLPEDIVAATRYAAKGNKFTDLLGKVAAGSRNVLVEAQEEMNQSFFSATAKAKAMGSTTEFLERLYDPMAVHDTVSWLDAAKEGMRQSWLNKDDWVEGFAGGFMGFMGLPSISVKVDENTGKQKPKLTMEGGVWSPIREQNNYYKRRNELIDNLNNRLSSKEFLNYYYGKIGNRHFDSIKEDMVKRGDKKGYEKADHAQLINDLMMFENAGRLQDFLDIIDSFDNISDDKIKEVKSLFPESADVQSYTESGMRKLINDNVSKMKRQVDDYMKVSDDIRTTFGNGIGEHAIAELTWQTTHLNEIEHDLKEILTHPETTSMLSEYRSIHGESTEKLTDYEVVSSDSYRDWLVDKYNSGKDTTSKSELKIAIQDAKDANYDMGERLKYINSISELSTDPMLIQKRMESKLREVEHQRQMAKWLQSAIVMSATDKLSEFIAAVEDISKIPSDETLINIKNWASEGNKVAEEYLTARDIDSAIGDRINKLGDELGMSENDKKKALDAWNYLKLNSDTLYDLTSNKTTKDIAADIADEKAINLLNAAVKSLKKERDLYKKIKRREIKKKPVAKVDGTTNENVTKFETTGKKLTKERYHEIADDIRKSARSIFGLRGAIPVLDLERAGMLYDGVSASGRLYLYYPGNKTYRSKDEFALPEIYDSEGNQLSKSDIEKLTGPNGQNITAWLMDNNFPVKALSQVSVIDPAIAKRNESIVPIGSKSTRKTKTVSTDNGSDEGKGSKTNPHKFIAPNMDISLLGGDSHAVAELLKSLPEDSELRFGIEEEDGPIYILAGDSNLKIGTLPREGEDTDTYSGLSELEALIREEFEETEDRRNADGMWVSEKYVNHIRQKRNSGFEPIADNIPVNQIPGFEGIKKPIIMLVRGEGSDQTLLFSDNSVSEKDLQLRAGSLDVNTLKSGFAYLLVPSGKKFIPVMLYTENVNEQTLNLRDPKVISKGFGKRVSDTIDQVVKAITTKDNATRMDKFKFWALNARQGSGVNSLQRLLYFNSAGRKEVQFFTRDPEGKHQDWFQDEDILMVINQHDRETGEDDYIPIVKGLSHPDGSEYSLRDQIIDAIYSIETETESGNVHQGPIAQVHPMHFDNKADLAKRITELIDSNMFLTDVKDFNLEMPSFIMDYWSVGQKKFIRPSMNPVKTSASSSNIAVKRSKSKGNQKIAEMEVGGETIQFNLSTNEAKIGKGKWFSMVSANEAQEKQVKKLGYKDSQTFIRVARALATIADRYGDSDSGHGRIGNRVLLKGFSGRKDEGFVITDDGGRFMSATELKKFKDELKKGPAKKTSVKKDEEVSRMKEEKRRENEQRSSKDDDEEYDQISESTTTPKDEIEKMETIHNVRQAIEHLRKYAPQYAPFLDYISKIRYYDQVLIELSNLVDYRNKDIRGRNKIRFRGNEFTNSIVIGRNSFGYRTMMHEIVHAFTSVALKYDSNLRGNIQTEMDYIRDIVGDRKLMSALGAGGMYAFENPYEFIAEFFSNPKLQEIVNGIKEPIETAEESTNIFVKIINFIAGALRHLFNSGKDSRFETLKKTLYSVVDRQVELHEAGEAVFKTKAEFDKSTRLASASSVQGVALAAKIPTVEENLDFRYVDPIDGDRSAGVVELKKYSADRTGQNIQMNLLYQLLNPEDSYSSYSGMNRLLNSENVYEYSCGTSSSFIGVKSGDVFVVVRSVPVVDSEGSYDTLVMNASSSRMPIILGVNESDVSYYKKLGMRKVHESAVNGKVFMANNAFTDNDLFNLGTTFRPFAEVLDNNRRFDEFRRQTYSDSEWSKFSELEKYHARKCIGI